MWTKNEILLTRTMTVLFSIILLIFIGCEQSSTEPQSELKLSDAAKNGLVSGWQSLHSIKSSGQISEIVSSDPLVENDDVEGLNTKTEIQQQCVTLKKNMKKMISENSSNTLVKGDTLIWFMDITNPVSGISVRKGLYYNDETGHARSIVRIQRGLSV